MKVSDRQVFNISLTSSNRILKTLLNLSFFFYPLRVETDVCSILMKPTWIWTADRDIEYFTLCFVFDHGLLMAGMGHESIIQVESFLIFHSGSFLKGNKARVTYQPELLWESLFNKLLIPEGLCRGFRCDSLLMKELTNSAQHTKNTLTARTLYTTVTGNVCLSFLLLHVWHN